MSHEYQKLMNEIQKQVNQNFKKSGHLDEYFLKVLENFAYRYMEDPKCAKANVHKIGPNIYQVTAKTWSFKRPLEIIKDKEVKNMLVSKMKELVGTKKRADAEFKFIINAQNLDDDGEGILETFAAISWDFPEHKNPENCHFIKKDFESSSWTMLRKELPLFLEEAFDFF